MGINFPDAPTTNQLFMGYMWDGEKWASQGTIAPVGAIRYDTVQGLTSAQMSQGRANINVAKKNYIVNGAMMVSQQNGSAAASIVGVQYYPADQFWGYSNIGGVTVGQSTATALFTPGGSPNRIAVTVTTAVPSVASGYYTYLAQKIEALRMGDLLYGSANAKTATLQFGVRAPAGTYCVSLLNADYTRVYMCEYVISAGEANTDVVRSLTFPGDAGASSSWARNNQTGMEIRWGLMAGTDLQIPAGGWKAASNTGWMGSPNISNFMSTVNNVFHLFDVSLTEGAVATPFVMPDCASELLACQRYYQLLSSVSFYTAAPFIYQMYSFVTGMRTSPSIVAAADGGFTGMTFQGGGNCCFMLNPGPSASVSGGYMILNARL